MKKITFLTASVLILTGSFVYADIDNMNIGGDLLGQYFFGKGFNLNDEGEVDFFRIEAHLWFQADLDDNIMARISLEVDRALNSSNIGGTNTIVGNGIYMPGYSDGNSFGDLDVFLEEAFVKVADIGGSGISASFGRQFLNYGDDPLADNYNQWWGPGAIIADSLTNDPLQLYQLGSYEIDPFDALVMSYETDNARLDIGHLRIVEDNISGPGYIISTDGEDLLIDTWSDDDTKAWFGYFSYFLEGHQIDIYANWTDMSGSTSASGIDGIISDILGLEDISIINSDLDKYIFGARLAGDITEQFAYKAEVAYQIEDSNNDLYEESDALFAQAGINYHTNGDYNPNIGFIYTFLQEDGAYGFWSPFEGKTYGQIFEGIAKLYGVSPFTNMHVFNLNGGFEPMENVAWTADFFYFLLDDDDLIGEDDGGFEIDTQIDYRFNDNLTTFLGGGVYVPGDAPEDRKSVV